MIKNNINYFFSPHMNEKSDQKNSGLSEKGPDESKKSFPVTCHMYEREKTCFVVIDASVGSTTVLTYLRKQAFDPQCLFPNLIKS